MEIDDPYYDPTLPQMNDYLHLFTEEELDKVADKFFKFVLFCRKYIKNLEGYPLEIEWHQVPWVLHLMLHKFLLILAPRGHGKSTIFTSWMLFELTEDHRLRFLLASHIEELAEEFSLRVQSYLEEHDPEPPPDTPYLLRDYPALKKGKKWTGKRAYFKGALYPYVKVVAVKGGMTGGRYDIAVFDDPFTKLSIDSDKMRRRFSTWAHTSVLPALDRTRKQKSVVIGTRKNLEDWYQYLMENPKYACHVDQLYYYDELGEKRYLWPAIEVTDPETGETKIKDHAFNEEREDDLRVSMEPDEFAMEMMNIPIAAKGLRFDIDWLAPFYYNDWRKEVPERHREIYMGIDPTIGSKTDRASYMGLAVVCFDKRPDKQDIYVVDMVRSKLSLVEQAEIIIAKLEEWKPHAAMIEKELVNQMFSDRMLKQMPILQPVVYRAHGASTNLKGSTDIKKIARIENIIGWLFKKGKVRFKDPQISPMSKIFIEAEYLQFPEGKLDLMDALNMACDRIDSRARITSFTIWKY